MIKDFSVVVVDMDDNPVMAEVSKKNPNDPNEKPALKITTCGTLAVNALLHCIDDKNLDGEEKLDRYELAMRINRKKEVEVSDTEIELMRTLVGIMYGPLLVGQFYRHIQVTKVMKL